MFTCCKCSYIYINLNYFNYLIVIAALVIVLAVDVVIDQIIIHQLLLCSTQWKLQFPKTENAGHTQSDHIYVTARDPP